MKVLHSLLRRQLKRFDIAVAHQPQKWLSLIEAVDAAYDQFDDDRSMLERALELSSQELLQANSEMRAIFQALPDLFFRLDATDRIIDTKGGGDGDFYLPPKSLLGKRLQDIPDQAAAAKLLEALNAVKRAHALVTAEYKLDIQEREQFYEARLFPVLRDNTIVIIRNISERKRTEQALHQSRLMLQLVLDNIPQRVFWKDRQCRYLGCNLAFARDAGLNDPAEILGCDDFRLPWGADAELYQGDDRQVMESGQAKLGYEEPKHRPGQRSWVRTSKTPLHDLEGTIFGVLGTYEDITASKLAEKALRESEQRYAMAALATGQLIYDWDLETGTIRWAGAIEKITGFPHDEFQTIDMKRWIELIHPEDRGAATTLLNTCREEGASYHDEYRFQHRDGAYRHLENTGVFLRDSHGDLQHMIGAIKDITDRIIAQQERQRVEEQLRQAMKMEAIGRLAGGIAHDFNNILTCITGFSEVLIDSLSAEDPMAIDLQEIKKAATRGISLTSQLLAFSRKQIIVPRIIDLNYVVTQYGRMLQRIIGEDIQLHLDLTDQLTRTLADPGQMEQVLINLAINARDAMPQGGTLTIRTARDDLEMERTGSVEKIDCGTYVVLTVSDTGSGITDETKQHLFEPFFTTKEKGKGTGLGLSMIYGVVKRNNGFIDVRSKVGQGATFIIYLPYREGSSEFLALESRPAISSGRETILLVEDEESVRRLAKRILERQGYHLLEAATGGDALLQYEKTVRPIDLVITDMIMPHMNGRELYERLSRDQPDLPVIYMSGYTDDVIFHQESIEERTSFLQKPFTVVELTSKVREVLDSRSSDKK